MKRVKIEKFWSFCFFRGQFEMFFIKKTAIISLEKHTGLIRFPC